METPSYVALSRQTALVRQMDVVANNLANVATPGFKA
jgi:flagellar basal-body rod protein FlgF